MKDALLVKLFYLNFVFKEINSNNLKTSKSENLNKNVAIKKLEEVRISTTYERVSIVILSFSLLKFIF